jgi:selenophosphate synthetase-related protein
VHHVSVCAVKGEGRGLCRAYCRTLRRAVRKFRKGMSGGARTAPAGAQPVANVMFVLLVMRHVMILRQEAHKGTQG